MLEFIKKLFDLQHFNENFLIPYGNLTYAILFFIIFAETGFVVTPFLPGDSLLFAVGALSAKDNAGLDLTTLIVLLSLAAIIGNTINYRIGYFIGPKIFEQEKIRFIKKEYLLKTQAFYDKYGVMAVILSRFVPIIRTFVPFIAGISQMDWKKYMLYNIIGGLGWVIIGTVAGYLFGNIDWVQKHFEAVLIAIVLISVLPAIVSIATEFFKGKKV